MSEWISVDERLPEPHTVVLTSTDGVFRVGLYAPDCGCAGKWHGAGMGSQGVIPTHWMPLPDPPKDSE